MNVNNSVTNSHPTTVKSLLDSSSATTTITTATTATNLTQTPQLKSSKHTSHYNNKHSHHFNSEINRSHPRSMTNSFDMSAIAADLPPNTGPPGTVSITSPNGNSGSSSSTANKNLSHVPCKFFKQGICQAGNSCPFSHNLEGSLAADRLPCKYFQKGNCKFGLKCALAHFLPDGTRVNSKNLLNYNSNGNGNSQTRHPGARRSASFNNYNTNSHQNNNTLLESSDSTPVFTSQQTVVGTSPTNRQISSANSFATFINIGNNQPQQQQQPLKAQVQPAPQQPISLQPQQFVNRSSSFGSQDSNYFLSQQAQPTHQHQNSQSQFQFPAANLSQPSMSLQSSSYSFQSQKTQQPLFFGSNSYSGAFSTNSTMTTQGSLARSYSTTDYPVNTTSPPQTVYVNAFTNGPPSASSTVTRYSFGSRLATPSSSATAGYFYQDSSAIVDDDDYQDDADYLPKSLVYEEDYVPGSLSDVILTPQELQRRDSRSQSGTLSVRPKLNTLIGTGNPNDNGGLVEIGLDYGRNINLTRDPFKKDNGRIGAHQEDVFLME